MFNNLSYWLFLVFAVTNLIAGTTTYFFCPESGGRSFEENQEFFAAAKDEKTWNVIKVKKGQWRSMPKQSSGETEPLLRRVADQAGI